MNSRNKQWDFLPSESNSCTFFWTALSFPNIANYVIQTYNHFLISEQEMRGKVFGEVAGSTSMGLQQQHLEQANRNFSAARPG